jgi:spore maturation protein CgeB
MNLYAANLEAVRRSDPSLAELLDTVAPSGEYAVVPARNGLPTAKLRDAYLHSHYDPQREAEQWADGVGASLSPQEAVTVLGFGLGWHLKALAARGFGGVVLEQDPCLIRSAMAHLELSDVLERFRVITRFDTDGVRRAHGDLLTGRVLAHPASVRLQPGALGALERYGEGLRLARNGGLNILVVNPIYGGSLPAAHHCASALREMGHLVTTFSSEEFASGMRYSETFRFNGCRTRFRSDLASLLSKGVELMVEETKPDMVLALAQAPLSGETLDRLTGRGIPVAFWFVEDYRVLTYWRDAAPHYSYFFGIQKEDFAGELAAAGVRNYSYLPTAAAPEVHAPMHLSRGETEEYGSDVSFVGAGYYNRRRFFLGLLDYHFRIWGSEWPLTPPLGDIVQRDGARIDTGTTVRIFNASPVNLNLHSSLHHEGVVPSGDFVNPRTFEIASCGAFQLVDRRTLLGELFGPGEMETFGDLAELRCKLDHFLAHPEERTRIAGRGRSRVLAEHTYGRRMEQLLATMLVSFPQLAEVQRARLDRHRSLAGDALKQEGLQDLLDRLPERRWHRLEDIWNTISTGENELTRAEKIFLLLRNVELKLD